jgi:hypothetical protein
VDIALEQSEHSQEEFRHFNIAASIQRPYQAMPWKRDRSRGTGAAFHVIRIALDQTSVCPEAASLVTSAR